MKAERKNLICLATETLLLFSLTHSPQPIKASNSTLQACPAGEGGEKGTIVVEGSSVRSGPTTKSERVVYLRQGTALTVLEVQDGESVSQLGKSDDHW
ncbi:SH3 domain-containing protein [Candidatus Gottesmanbacteria bacterium]|nr:SH3 domain-containing protein [Candidatus Gottesmanbacteria bacterium]